METISVQQARQTDSIGRAARLQGWIRTRRDSKGGFSFLEVNDGSCLANIQVIADADLPNYESEIKKLSAGCSVTVEGEVKESGGKGQSTRFQLTGDHQARGQIGLDLGEEEEQGKQPTHGMGGIDRSGSSA